MAEVERKKPHHLSKEYREAKEKGLLDQDGYLIEDNLAVNQPKEELQKPQENVEEKEPSIPLSQVGDLVKQEVEKALAQFKPQVEAKEEVQKPIQPVNFGIQNKTDLMDSIPDLQNFEYKDRRYVSLISKKAVSDEVLSRHKAKSPLQYTHPISKKVLTLRYASNQSSFFVEEQTGDVLLTYIVMKDGFLFVPKENTTLQKFLAIHPHNGFRFKELDQEVEDQLQLDQEEQEFKAQKMARELSDIKRDAIARLLCPTYSEDWTTATVKKEIYLKAKQNPKRFIGLCEDNTLEMKGVIKTAMHRDYIAYKNFAFYDADDNFIVAVNRNDDEIETMVSYLSTNKGLGLYEYLKKAVS